MKLSDAVILITGGANGIGKFMATRCQELGAKVIVIDKNKEALLLLEKEKNISGYACDLSNADEVESVIAKIFEVQKDINVLVNNAGIIHSESLFNMMNVDSPKHKIDTWKKTIDVNLNAVFYATVNVVSKMRANRVSSGLIVNISSISAQGNMGQSAYAASKAGLEALTKTWSKELGIFKIRSVAIAPGFLNTESTKQALSENMLKKWEQAVPLKRLGTLDEITSALIFVIENDYFNGKVLSVDGGLTI